MNDNVKSVYIQNIQLRQENEKLKEENSALKQELTKTRTALSFANKKIEHLENKIQNMEKEFDKKINSAVEKAVSKVTDELNHIHKEEVDKLNVKITGLEKKLKTDSTNSGIPTSKNRIEKKVIQNNREKSDKDIGAQEGHKIHKLNYFREDEITNTVEHTLDKCPECGGQLQEDNVVKSDIVDIEVKVTKTRNYIHNYKCTCCKKRVSANNKLPRGASYGENINAIALSMMNEENTALNKITTFISGITDNEVNLSEGYLIKLQNKAVNNLGSFLYELEEKVKTLKRVFWDDTVVSFGVGEPKEGYDEKDIEYMSKEENKDKKVRGGIIRFYGDDKYALLIGHRNKDKNGIDADGILGSLSEDCVVMHDHVLLNYNDEYCFKNAECNEHTRRYLKDTMETFPDHKWANQMRDYLAELNNKKKELQSKEINQFEEEELREIFSKYDEIIKLGYKENDTVPLQFIDNKKKELNLIERLEKFKENHLMFITDFSVAFTNNTSERGLRQVKRKIAVSFMFKNANRMKDYASILSYLETAYRNGISRYEASKRLVANNPYTLDEIINGNA